MAEGLRFKTQVHGTPSGISLSNSSLSDLPSPLVPRHARVRVPHWPASSLPPPPSRRLPTPPPSHTPLPAPGPNHFTTKNLTEAQIARLFEIELTKSEHQMRQAAAAANQAERLYQVSKEKALLEIEYLRREGDACLTALNTCQEPGTQGIQDRSRDNDENDNTLGETITLEVSARRDIFSGLPEEEIVKIFKNKFKPINLYNLRHLYGFQDTWEEDNIVVKNGSLQLRKTMGTYKDFGRFINKFWSEAFLNYMLVVNILFGTPELSVALLLFYRQIRTLAQSYDWLKDVFPLALEWYKHIVIYSSFDPSHKKIAHNYQVSYCNNITVRSLQLLGGVKRQRSISPSSHNKKRTLNNGSSICKGFNREGCIWKPYCRAHKYQKYNSKDHGAKNCQKKSV